MEEGRWSRINYQFLVIKFFLIITQAQEGKGSGITGLNSQEGLLGRVIQGLIWFLQISGRALLFGEHCLPLGGLVLNPGGNWWVPLISREDFRLTSFKKVILGREAPF